MTRWRYAWRITGTCALCRPFIGGNLNSIFIDICLLFVRFFFLQLRSDDTSLYCIRSGLFIVSRLFASQFAIHRVLPLFSNDIRIFNASIIVNLLAILSLSMLLRLLFLLSLFYLNEPRTYQTLGLISHTWICVTE